MPDRLPYYFVTVPIVFVLSAAASFIMNLVAKLLIDGFKSLANIIKDLRSKPDKGKWQHIIFAVLMLLDFHFGNAITVLAVTTNHFILQFRTD